MAERVSYERTPLGADGELSNREREEGVKTEELAILCIDISSSMSEPVNEKTPGTSKADDVSKHICDRDGLLHRLATGTNRRSYHVGFVLFDHGVKQALPHPLVESEDAPAEFYHIIPKEEFYKHTGTTNIARALSCAAAMALGWLGDPVARGRARLPLRVATILLFTDGDDTAGSDPEAEAARIKGLSPTLPGPLARALGERKALTIATVAYGDGADKALLKSIASAPRFFTEVEAGKGEDLRDFFLASLFER